jgi:hypothetical protein
MTSPARATITLSLVSHTNVGKTTLARTLLGRDIGVVRDEAHVTEIAEAHLLVDTPEGDRLMLWDTPGFGDSARLAKRLLGSQDPLGWFLSQVWDRLRDRALWSSQQALRNVREHADIVLYLVNAAEAPVAGGAVDAELRILAWVGKPVIILLNQLGAPGSPEREAAELENWRTHVKGQALVRAILPLDAFARCWVQEAALLRSLTPLVGEDQQKPLKRLTEAWLSRRLVVYRESMRILASRLAQAATDSEVLDEAGIASLLRDAINRGPSGTREAAMRALAERLDANILESTGRLIATHGIDGCATREILSRLADSFSLQARVDESKAAVIGATVTGALAGLKADLATGGLSFGAGLLAGGALGALAAFGLARGYNLARGLRESRLTWSEPMLDALAAASLLGYLAVAHHGRGRGNWSPAAYPDKWRDEVDAVLATKREALARAWALRASEPAHDSIAAELEETLGACALELLERLYPDAAPPLSLHR